MHVLHERPPFSSPLLLSFLNGFTEVDGLFTEVDGCGDLGLKRIFHNQLKCCLIIISDKGGTYLVLIIEVFTRGLLPEKANLSRGSDAKPKGPKLAHSSWLIAHSLDWGKNTFTDYQPGAIRNE